MAGFVCDEQFSLQALRHSVEQSLGMTNQPVSCRYFYGDYFRGKNKETCRLIEGNPKNDRPWRRKLCDSCPVPALLITSNTRDLLLEAKIKRKFLRDTVEVTFAVCAKHMLELSDPFSCPACAKEQSID